MSENKPHVLAAARKIAMLTQDELSELLNCHVSTVRYIELGRLKMSEGFAGKVSQELGVHAGWLLMNNQSIPPETNTGEPFTKAAFDQWRARLYAPKIGASNFKHAQQRFMQLSRRIAWMMVAAHRDDKLGLLSYKLGKALEDVVIDVVPNLADEKLSVDCPVEGHQLMDLWPPRGKDSFEELAYIVGGGFIEEELRRCGKFSVKVETLNGHVEYDRGAEEPLTPVMTDEERAELETQNAIEREESLEVYAAHQVEQEKATQPKKRGLKKAAAKKAPKRK